ncbi:MAG: hypothetical protein KGI75_31670, partial [Rhizobiaceae bacterium]|nr:hypothetical protein [Rhizobiaceae bacterium]
MIEIRYGLSPVTVVNGGIDPEASGVFPSCRSLKCGRERSTSKPPSTPFESQALPTFPFSTLDPIRHSESLPTASDVVVVGG